MNVQNSMCSCNTFDMSHNERENASWLFFHVQNIYSFSKISTFSSALEYLLHHQLFDGGQRTYS